MAWQEKAAQPDPLHSAIYEALNNMAHSWPQHIGRILKTPIRVLRQHFDDIEPARLVAAAEKLVRFHEGSMGSQNVIELLRRTAGGSTGCDGPNREHAFAVDQDGLHTITPSDLFRFKAKDLTATEINLLYGSAKIWAQDERLDAHDRGDASDALAWIVPRWETTCR